MLANTVPNRRLKVPHVVVALLWGGLFALPFGYILNVSGLSLALAALTLFVGALTATFSCRYMRSDPHSGHFFLTLALLVVSVLVFVLSTNLLLFALGWCASGWLLAQLVGHVRGWPEAQAAQRRTRLSFLVGDSGLVAALIILALHANSLDVATALKRSTELSPNILALVTMALIASAAARCALPPFSGWLMSSMTAPTPVSALMHAGLVNAGGFLLLRFAPLFEAAPLSRYAAVTLGLIAAVWGIGVMVVRPDIKGSIAGSTIAQMGFMIMSCGLGAYSAALWHLIAHGLFKAWLFLGSGSAIGMTSNMRSNLISHRGASVIAGLALVGAGLAVFSGQTNGEVIPLTLGMVTAAATLTSIGGIKFLTTARLWLVALIIVLVTFNIGGVMLAREAMGHDGPDLLGPWTLLALLSAFLASWLWQRGRLVASKPLSSGLYVHLLNSGAMR